MDPFATPEAVVEVHVDGVPSLHSGLKTKIFPLTADENEPHTFKGLQTRIKQHFRDGSNKIVNLKLSSDKRHLIIRRAFGTSNVTANKPNPPLKLKYLNPEVEEDNQFLKELKTLRIIIGKVRSGAIIPDNLIDFYYLRFRTLHILSDFYGPISVQIKEAKYLLGDALQELNKAFVKAYDGSVLVAVVTIDVAHTRRSARSAMNPPGHSKKWPYEWLDPPLDWKKIPIKPKEKPGRRDDENEKEEKELIDEQSDKIETKKRKENELKVVGEKGDEVMEPNLEREGYESEGNEGESPFISRTSHEDEEYSHKKKQNLDCYVIFNIFLWFGVSFGFSMLAIVYACMDMDPGRDTIIYRLTNMRTKKEM